VIDFFIFYFYFILFLPIFAFIVLRVRFLNKYTTRIQALECPTYESDLTDRTWTLIN